MSVVVNGVTFTGSPCRVVETVLNGRRVVAGERTMALVLYADWWLRTHVGCYLYVVQSAYNTGVEASAGTHDFDGCLDFYIIRIKSGRKVWIKGQRWLRRLHWFAWLRNTGAWYRPSSWHFHAVCIGVSETCKVGVYVPGQEDDGWNGKSGLVGHVTDPTWRPERYKPFNFQKWYREQEDDMPAPKDWDREDWAAFREHMAEGWLDVPLNTKTDGEPLFRGVTVREALKRLVRPLLREGGDKK